MYKKIMVAVDHTASDKILIEQAILFAKFSKAEILVIHVADGWAARQFDHLKLTESEEMKADRDYIDECAKIIEKEKIKATAHLALGEPAEQILKIAQDSQCDLLILRTHGHRFLGDLVYGQTIEEVRHKAKIPLLIFPA
jgi:nucleotide-binding universal stress UspA family protein